HDPLQTGANKKRRARWRPFIEMATWFQRDVQGAACGVYASLPQGDHFSMRAAGSLMIAYSDDPVLSDHHCGDGRVGTGTASSTSRERQGLRHEALVLCAAGRRQPSNGGYVCELYHVCQVCPWRVAV